MTNKSDHIVLHIPAREGSKRVPGKNMRLMHDKPMISYAIEAAINSGVADQVYINTDCENIKNYASTEFPKCNVYERDAELASDTASSDQFNYDIISKLDPDILIMINPVCPLIEASDIQAAFERFKNTDCDTLISANSTQMQTFCDAVPVNINDKEQLAPSQDNQVITILNWAITIWDVASFKDRMQNLGFAVLGEKREFFELAPIKSVKVSEEKDFLFAEMLINNKVNLSEN